MDGYLPGVPEVDLHGHRMSYRLAGDGPAILLLHGITSSSRSWASVIEPLADQATVIAPDLPGHGQSDKPKGDYSLGSYASALRDLLAVIDVPRVTVVGHSLGGGVAMQFVYQFPERVDRLVLVSSGGLGEEVSLALRAATLPGAELVLPVLFGPWAQTAGRVAGTVLGRLGVRSSANTRGLVDGMASLRDGEARRAFVQSARAVIDARGQRIDARARLYLAESLPTMLVWGDADAIIPLAHGQRAHELMPHSRLEVFPGAGHFPFNDDPERFVDVLADFIATTDPSDVDEHDIAALLRRGA
ncbi:MAG: alpha/beta fold hydrolase [Solirubrobacteraceae bacterium]|nr:alpha/beta fold hydrolase [Solirubrobacteraceae bacterium]